MREPLNRLSATRLAQMIAAGDVTSEVVTRSFIDAIHERNASIEASFLRTTVSVRKSRAAVSTPLSGTLILNSEQRADVNDAGAIIGPLPTERNLIVDGTFDRPLGEVWKVEQRADSSHHRAKSQGRRRDAVH